jgi:hypothetical protein
MTDIFQETDQAAAASTTRGMAWKFTLLQSLSSDSAPRVLETSQLLAAAKRLKSDVTEATVRLLAKELVESGVLEAVGHGMYLNLRKYPGPTIEEVVPKVRAGAIASGSWVLGMTGAKNNPDDRVVTAVVPVSKDKRPNTGRVELKSGHAFHVYGLAERFFSAPAGKESWVYDKLEGQKRFTPTAALLHWIHLAHVNRAKTDAAALTDPPPGDVDFSDQVTGNPAHDCDLSHAKTLAAHWGMDAEFSAWMAKWEHAHRGRESYERGEEAYEASVATRRPRP